MNEEFSPDARTSMKILNSLETVVERLADLQARIDRLETASAIRDEIMAKAWAVVEGHQGAIEEIHGLLHTKNVC